MTSRLTATEPYAIYNRTPSRKLCFGAISYQAAAALAQRTNLDLISETIIQAATGVYINQRDDGLAQQARSSQLRTPYRLESSTLELQSEVQRNWAVCNRNNFMKGVSAHMHFIDKHINEGSPAAFFLRRHSQQGVTTSDTGCVRFQ